MPAELRCALFTPISTHQPGNGLAHRARFWQEVLRELGTITTVHVVLAGPPVGGGDELVPQLTPAPGDVTHLPTRARPAPESSGRRWAAGREPFDIVVVLRSYTAPFAFGAVAGTDAFVLVDLDDDDVDFARATGDDAEAARFAALIDEIGARADVVVSAAGHGTTRAVPNSVADVEVPPTQIERQAGRVLMVGNFGYEPNVRGARWLIDDVLPLVRDAGIDPELVVAGPGSESLEPFGIGFCADLDALYASAAVAVVPLLHGSGSRIKAIEAFVHGVPVVGTTSGLDGLAICPGVDCLVADTPSEFAGALVSVLGDPERGAVLAASARDGVVPHYMRARVRADAVELIRSAVGERAEVVLAPAGNLDVTETEDGIVVLDRTSMVAHHLNPTTASVFMLLDGRTTLAEIATELQHVYGLSETPTDTVLTAADMLVESGLVVAHRHRPQGDRASAVVEALGMRRSR